MIFTSLVMHHIVSFQKDSQKLLKDVLSSGLEVRLCLKQVLDQKIDGSYLVTHLTLDTKSEKEEMSESSALLNVIILFYRHYSHINISVFLKVCGGSGWFVHVAS